MKKLFSLAMLVLFVGITVSSCKSHERCPAYGKLEQRAKKSV